MKFLNFKNFKSFELSDLDISKTKFWSGFESFWIELKFVQEKLQFSIVTLLSTEEIICSSEELLYFKNKDKYFYKDEIKKNTRL